MVKWAEGSSMSLSTTNKGTAGSHLKLMLAGLGPAGNYQPTGKVTSNITHMSGITSWRNGFAIRSLTA